MPKSHRNVPKLCRNFKEDKVVRSNRIMNYQKNTNLGSGKNANSAVTINPVHCVDRRKAAGTEMDPPPVTFISPHLRFLLYYSLQFDLLYVLPVYV